MKLRAPTCPRCGYDLSGQVCAAEALDASSFPLDGLCSECGLGFLWRDVFRPGFDHVRGFFEHSRLRTTPVAAWRTWLWTLWPSWFWAKVRLEHRPRIGRTLLWVLFVLGGPWFLACVPYGLTIWPGMLRHILVSMPRWRFVISPWTMPWYIWSGPAPKAADPVMGWFGQFPVFVCVGVAVSLVFPMVLLCLPMTLARGKVHASHVLRAAIYQLAWLAPVFVLVAVQVLCAGVAMYIMNSRSSRWIPVPGQPGVRTLSSPDPHWMQAAERYAHDTIRSIGEVGHDEPVFPVVFVSAWWAWWWWSALHRGFRLRDATMVWCIVMVPTLIAAAGVLLVHPDFLRAVLR